MGQITRRMLRSSMLAAFLLAACTSAPAATQDATQVQQFIKDSVAGTVAAEKALETPQGVLDVATPTPLPDTAVPSPSLAPTLDFVTVTPQPTETPVLDVTTAPIGFDIYCEPIVNSTQQPQLPTQVASGSTVTIENNVNLRAQPSRLKRIILVLKKGTQVKIIGGPVTTNYGPGYKYFWWQLELPGGVTGWAAEMSVCGRYYFMEPTP